MGALFSTSDLCPSERFDYWHEIVYRTYAACNGTVDYRDDFRAELNVASFGPAEITNVSSTAVRYERRPHDIRVGPRDDVFVSVMLQGETRFTQNGTTMLHRPGDILIYDAAKPYVYDYEHDYEALLLRVPRPILEARRLTGNDLGGRLIPAASPFGRLIGSLIHESYHMAISADVPSVSDFAPSVLDMVTTAIRQSSSENHTSDRSGLALARVKQHMRAHLSDTSLTLERISREQNMSLRTLSRIFAETGVTPMGWLQSERLKLAYAALAEGKVRSVTEAALEYGFTDLSHFGRSFKKVYGLTPKSLFSNAAR